MEGRGPEHVARRWLVVVPLLLVGGSALSYGAVYPATYWPLLAICTAVGVAALLRVRLHAAHARSVKRLFWAFTAVGVALAVQLLPLPQPLLRTLSPASDRFLTRVDLTYAPDATGVRTDARRPAHALSVNPRRTLLASAFFVAFAVYLLGLLGVIQLAASGLVLANGLAALGVAVALVGVLLPPPAGAPAGFAPFVNRNHFAGWMSMAMSLGLGVFAARLSVLQRSRLSRRDRFLYFGTSDGARLILATFAPLVMFASVMMSMSRSGVLACAMGALVIAAFGLVRGTGARGRLTVAGSIAAVMLAAALWSGADLLVARFEAAVRADFATRVAAWTDAWRVAREFPLTGSGLNTYTDAMLLYQKADSATHYTAAHNEYLQLAAEGGILLIVPVAIAIGVFVRELRVRLADDEPDGRTYWIRRGAIAAMVAIAFQSMFDFSLQIPATALFFATLCGLALHYRPPPQRTPRRRLQVVSSSAPVDRAFPTQ